MIYRLIMLSLLLSLLVNLSFSQTIHDAVFKNVIIIKDNTVQSHKSSYSFKPALVSSKGKPVFSNESSIPFMVLVRDPKFCPFLKEFIIIQPDLAYYKAVSKSIEGGCAEPITTNIYYEVKRNASGYTIDSVRIQNNNQPKVILKVN